MLNQKELLQLHHELGRRKVLSVYLKAEEADPAERRAWRVRLNATLRALETRLAAWPAEEWESVRAALEHVEGELQRFTGQIPERGWVAFATQERLWHAGSSPVPMPDLVRWEPGPHIAPYVRALKQSRPVTAVLADRRRARIFHCLYGYLQETGVVHAEAAQHAGVAAGSGKRAATRSGMRGETRGDAALRTEGVATHRMLRDACEVVSERVGDDGLLVVSGSTEATAIVLRALPERLLARTIEVPALPIDASDAEVRDAVESAASALSARLHTKLVDEVIETARSAGRGCLTPEHVDRALQVGAVETLVLSRALARAHPDLADRLVSTAYRKGAAVEEIPEAASGPLDAEGGVGARLRFAV
ncbi:MAG TPA: hypothetical protein VFL93_16060 [Longimicrobiaceae bacterium]|nr:hypothetical protein [Longimicrobiaceae bacterium]